MNMMNMIKHFKNWNDETNGWLIKCLDTGQVFELTGDWSDKHFCPYCNEEIPELSDMKYFKIGTGYLNKWI